MRRVLVAEVLLLILLAGVHLFVFARGMGDREWGSLTNTISLLQDRDLNLENNRLPVPGAENTEITSQPAGESGADYMRDYGPGAPPPWEGAPAGASQPSAVPEDPAPAAPRAEASPAPAGPRPAMPGAPPDRPAPPAGPGGPGVPPPGAAPLTPPAAAPSEGPAPPSEAGPYGPPMYSSGSQPAYPGYGAYPVIPAETRVRGPYVVSSTNKEVIVARDKPPLGASLFDLPFVWLSEKCLGSKALNAKATDLYYKELSPKQFAQVVGAVFSHGFWSILAVLLLFATFCKMDISRGDAFMATVLIFFSSSLTWYGASGSSYGVSTFTLSLTLFLFSLYLARLGEEPDKGYYVRWFLIGLSAGLAGVVAYVNAFLLPVFVIYLLLDRKSFPSSLGRIFVFVVGFAALWWLNPYYWWVQYGVKGISPLWEGMRFQSWYLAPVKTLFYFKNGFFLYSPLFLFGFLGLFMYLANRVIAPIEFRFAGLSMLCLLAMATVAGLQGEWSESGFGSYMLTPALLFTAIGVAQLLDADDKRFMRYVLSLAATAWSYLVFLFARSETIGSAHYVQGSITSYWHGLWSADYPWSMVFGNLVKTSYTLSFLLAPGHLKWLLLVAGIVVVVLLVCVWFLAGGREVERIGRRRGKGKGAPGDRWRTTESWKD